MPPFSWIHSEKKFFSDYIKLTVDRSLIKAIHYAVTVQELCSVLFKCQAFSIPEINKLKRCIIYVRISASGQNDNITRKPLTQNHLLAI